MNRAEKAEVISALNKRLQKAQLIAFADYRTVKVSEISALRRKFNDAGITYLVVKNTLARKAMEGTAFEPIGPKLKGMAGLIIVENEPIAAAKALRDILKDMKKAETFVVNGGFFDGMVLDGPSVDKVADLPGKEELLGKLLATLQEGPRQLVSVLQGPSRDLLYLLKNYESKLEEAGA